MSLVLDIYKKLICIFYGICYLGVWYLDKESCNVIVIDFVL